MTRSLRLLTVAALLGAATSAQAAFSLIAIGSFSETTDFAGYSETLENGVDTQNVFGGVGSGLTWAGGNTFLGVPDRGPNATTWNAGLDNTTSFIQRFETFSLNLTVAPTTVSVGSASAGFSNINLAYTLGASLTGTTLLSSSTALNYGSAGTTTNPGGYAGVVPTGSAYAAGAPAANTASQFYFTGRSDGFAAGTSSNPNNARLDAEAIRVSNDGTKVYVADEYGPYVYEFNRATGVRTNSFTLPSQFAIANQSPVGATEISNNTASGRVTNKGMEGLAISPDGKYLVGFMQSPLAQDGGDGGRANRLIRINVATGATEQFVYDNYLADKSKAYNSSEILMLNDHEALVLERDGKGLGDGTTAAVKRIYKIDLNEAGKSALAVDGSGNSLLSGEANLLASSSNLTKSLFLDIRAALNAAGITDDKINAKIEGMTFGQDIVEGGITKHTLFLGNDNDFIPGVAGNNKEFVFSFTDADLGGSTFQNQQISAVPEPSTYGLMGAGALGVAAFLRRRRAKAAK